MKYKYLFDVVSERHMQRCLDKAGNHGHKLISVSVHHREVTETDWKENYYSLVYRKPLSNK